MNDLELRLECLRMIISLNTSYGCDPRPAAERLYRFVKFGEHEDRKNLKAKMKSAPKPKGNGR